jgi:cysteine desulfurase
MFLSAHKAGGPKGVGALCFVTDALHINHPPQRGGGQERGLRAGTENVQAIIGLGALVRALDGRSEAETQAALRDEFERELRAFAPDALIFGQNTQRLPNTSSFALNGVKAQTMLMALDLAGVALSSGSACSSGKVTPSHVLAAMGVDAQTSSWALRLSLGFDTTKAQMHAATDLLRQNYQTLLMRRHDAA